MDNKTDNGDIGTDFNCALFVFYDVGQNGIFKFPSSVKYFV